MAEIVYAAASVTPEIVEASIVNVFDVVGPMLARSLVEAGAIPGPVLGIVDNGVWLDCFAVGVDA